MNKKPLDTDYIKFELIDDILHATYKPSELNGEVVKKVITLRKEYCENKTFPHLVMDYNVAKITKDARDFLSSDEATEGVAAGAVLADSSFKVMLANFFLKVAGPKIPTKLFQNKEEALKWLEQFK